MQKHFIDTDLYIDLIRTGESRLAIREIYERETPGIHFSSIVAQELLAGAQTATGKKLIRKLLRPFEKTKRIVTPTHTMWKEAGNILAEILKRYPNYRSKLRGFGNDVLLAVSARSIGATLYTRNREDFMTIYRIRPFSLVIIDGSLPEVGF